MIDLHSGKMRANIHPSDGQGNFYAFRMKGLVKWGGRCSIPGIVDENEMNDLYYRYYILSKQKQLTERFAWMDSHYVYTMTHPINNLVFYVGCTNNPVGRYIEHFFSQRNEGMKHIIDSMNVSDKLPVMTVVSSFTDREEAEKHEDMLIREYSKTHLLMNRQGAYEDFEFDHTKRISW